MAKTCMVAIVFLVTMAAGCGRSGQRDATGPPLSIATTSSTGAASTVEAEIRTAYAAYADAASQHRGSDAARLIAANADEYYDRLRRMAIEAPEPVLRRERTVDQLGVLLMRVQIDPGVLRTARPRDLIVAAINAGLIGEAGIARSGIGSVEVRGDTALAEILSDGVKTGLRYEFRNEGGWKIDIVALTGPAEQALQQAARQQAKPVSEFVDSLLEARLGAQRARDAWTPWGRG